MAATYSCDCGAGAGNLATSLSACQSDSNCNTTSMADATACNGKVYYYAILTSSGSNYKNWFHISSCTSCLAGYYEIKKSYDQFQTNCGKPCVFNYINCEKCGGIGNYYDSSSKSCKACTNAPSNATYTSNGGTSATGCSWQCNAGYYKNSNTCTKCAAGTYSAAGATVCTSCKTTTSNTSATSAEGSTTINDCYVPKTAQFTNTSGTWHYTDNCYYK